MASGPGNRALLWLWGLQVWDTNPIPLDSNNHLRLEITADFRKVNYYPGLPTRWQGRTSGRKGSSRFPEACVYGHQEPSEKKDLPSIWPRALWGTCKRAKGWRTGLGDMWLCHNLPTWQVTLRHDYSVKYKCPLGVGRQHSRVLEREFHRQDFCSKREVTEIRSSPMYFAKEEHLKRKRSKKKTISCLHPLIKMF